MHAQTPPVWFQAWKVCQVISFHGNDFEDSFMSKPQAPSVNNPAHSTRLRLAQGMRGIHSTRWLGRWSRLVWLRCRMACYEQASGAVSEQPAHSTRLRLAQGMRGTHSTRSWEKVELGLVGVSNGLP